MQSQSGCTSPENPPNETSGNNNYEDIDPFIPAGTKKYMLLLVNTGRLIKVANVDVTDLTRDEEVFERLRNRYRQVRGRRAHNPFIKPKKMHYIKVSISVK